MLDYYECSENCKKKENITCHKQKEYNSSGIAEVIVLLELHAVIESKGRNIKFGEIDIGFDYRNWCEKIVNQIKKRNMHAQEAGADILRIK